MPMEEESRVSLVLGLLSAMFGASLGWSSRQGRFLGIIG